MPAPLVKLMHDAAELIGLWPRLGEEAQMPSVTYRLLHGIDPRALESAPQIDPLTQDTIPYERLRDYLDRLRHVKTELDGHYLRSIGVAPGAIYRKVLDGLLDAKLDGLLHNRADEEEFVRQILKGEA